MGQIEIELLSDLCVSSGFVYNSSIDNDCCYDEYGLPYIPAKRLKGCLREVAQELNSWKNKKVQPIDIAAIFGDADGKQGMLKLSSAKLVKHDAYVEMLQNEKSKELTHQQKVLGLFTYIRTQTAIDYGIGTAKSTSLRRTRVVKHQHEGKSMIFQATFNIPKKYRKQLEMCCQGLKEMGLNRNRGFGSIKVSLNNKMSAVAVEKGYQDEDISLETIKYDEKEKPVRSRLHYRLRLLSPVLFKNNQVNQSENYIEGAKIVGYIAQHQKKIKMIL